MHFKLYAHALTDIKAEIIHKINKYNVMDD